MEEVLKTIKEIIDAMRGDRIKRKDQSVDESNADAELPKEFRLNIQSAIGCFVLVLVLLIINVLVMLLIKLSY